MSNATNDIMKKIAAISTQGITCIKNAENPYYNSKYADLGVVVDALKEPLKEQGLTYLFSVDKTNENDWVLKTYVSDGTDITLASGFPLVNSDPQKFGASLTYAKRYSLCTVFNVIAEADDDGNEASGVKPTLPKKKPVTLNVTQKSYQKEQEINDEIPTFF